MESITSAQELYLRLLEAGGRCNGFDGPRVSADLRAHKQLWQAAIVTRQLRVLSGTPITELRHRVDLIVLRDLPKDQVNLDHLFVIPEPVQQDALEQLARGWSSDELVWIALREASRAMGASKFQFPEFPSDEQRFLLSLWWD
jgi:hypothetical protein